MNAPRPVVTLALSQIEWKPLVLPESIRTSFNRARCAATPCGFLVTARSQRAILEHARDHDRWHAVR